MPETIPTVYEWAGGAEAFERLTTAFYERVRADKLVGALPLYAKAHSYGEYVFDWAWADAFRRHGRRYYPKLLAAIPFTPAPGPRLVARDGAARAALLDRAREMLGALDVRQAPRYSSLHVLFSTPEEADVCARAGMIIRHGVQFEWQNPGYRASELPVHPAGGSLSPGGAKRRSFSSMLRCTENVFTGRGCSFEALRSRSAGYRHSIDYPGLQPRRQLG